MQEVFQNPFFQIYLAFLGSLGFSILYHITGSRLFFASLGGAIAWGVYLAFEPLFPSEVLRFFLATLFTTVYGEVMARVQKSPTTTYLVPAIIPLIPGSGLYYTMNYAVRGEWDRFSARGLLTLKLTLALAAGIIVITSLTAIVKELLNKRKKRPKKKA